MCRTVSASGSDHLTILNVSRDPINVRAIPLPPLLLFDRFHDSTQPVVRAQEPDVQKHNVVSTREEGGFVTLGSRVLL